MHTQTPLDVILRDGTTLRLRSPAAQERHGFPNPTPALVEPMLDPDREERRALGHALT